MIADGGKGERLEGREPCDTREAERDEGKDEREVLWLWPPAATLPGALACAAAVGVLLVVRVRKGSAAWADAIPRSAHLPKPLGLRVVRRWRWRSLKNACVYVAELFPTAYPTPRNVGRLGLQYGRVGFEVD